MSFEDVIRQIIREENEKHYQRIEALLQGHQSDKPLTLTVDEAAHILNMGRTKVYELTQRNDFPALRDGRRVIIPYWKLMEWIDKNSLIKEAI